MAKTPFARIVARVRDGFSSAVLGTTSPAVPALSGGLSFPIRAAFTAGSLAVSIAIAFALRGIAGALSVFFLFPALMISGLFGATMLTALSLIVAVSVSALFFTDGLQTVLLAAAMLLQSGIALVLRELFRESRRWGVRYRKLLDSVSAGVVVSDMMGQILRPQPEFEQVIGMKWPEYSGMGWLKAVHPDDLRIGSGEPGVRDSVLRRTVRLRDAASNDWRWFQFRSVAVPGREGRPEELISVLFDVHKQRLSQEEREIQAGEMRHRWKNLMTVITAMATSSQPHGDKNVDAYVRKLLGRLNALSAAGDHAIGAPNQSVDIGDIIRATLAPFMEDNSRRIVIDGPPCTVSEQTSGALALGVHELATNALKYGALSVPEGLVSVLWNIADFGEGDRVTIEWSEKNGPAASEPARDGFGMRVIRFIPARERNGRVDLEYRKEGLRCSISFLRQKMGIAAE
jgi:two-component sensor histidine kinase